MLFNSYLTEQDACVRRQEAERNATAQRRVRDAERLTQPTARATHPSRLLKLLRRFKRRPQPAAAT